LAYRKGEHFGLPLTKEYLVEYNSTTANTVFPPSSLNLAK